MTSRDRLSVDSPTDARETFLAGIDHAVGFWLAFWRASPDNGAAQLEAIGHAVRALTWCMDFQRQPQATVELAIALHRHMERRGRWREWEALLVQLAGWAGPFSGR